MFSQSETLAVLPYYTHKRLTSMIMSGFGWIALAIIPVIQTQGLAQYASNYLPGLVFKNSMHFHNTPLGASLVFIILLSFVIINYFSLQIFARINAVFTFWKLITYYLLFTSHQLSF